MPRYHNLTTFQRARTLVRLINAATDGKRGDGDLVSQIRRASISVAANIAEGAERGSDRDFVRFLRIADGSNAEVQALTSIGGDTGLFAPAVVAEITAATAEVGRLIGGLIRRCRAGSG